MSSFGTKPELSKEDNQNKDKDKNDNNDYGNDDKEEEGTNKEVRTKTKEWLASLLEQYKIPLSHKCKIAKGATKSISSIVIEPAKSGRMIVVSYDNNVNFYDFGGMSGEYEYFRMLTPQDGYPVNSLDYNSTGACSNGSLQLFDPRKCQQGGGGEKV
ncbi:hypothetical protein RFI_39574 [Reticulomyxa filosa]|uniref:Uncharacterized protein n=1 Tax=Reticulomyxa filosa TaxID=46433 RepID=X6L8Y3_RETFI|nr:hypothetical protein RFI_39574 [Reticulomyxa filosa]|eukprot:ETN97948.1 hypothetical protein RFI_39574 [Reticulomyxa filosa]